MADEKYTGSNKIGLHWIIQFHPRGLFPLVSKSSWHCFVLHPYNKVQYLSRSLEIDSMNRCHNIWCACHPCGWTIQHLMKVFYAPDLKWHYVLYDIYIYIHKSAIGKNHRVHRTHLLSLLLTPEGAKYITVNAYAWMSTIHMTGWNVLLHRYTWCDSTAAVSRHNSHTFPRIFDFIWRQMWCINYPYVLCRCVCVFCS